MKLSDWASNLKICNQRHQGTWLLYDTNYHHQSPRDESYDDFSLNQIVYVGRYLRNQIGERSVGKRATRRHRHPLGRPHVCRFFKEFPWTRGRDSWANLLHSLKRAWSLLNIGEILFATRRCEKEKSKISAQDKVGNFSPRIKCRSFQNRLAIFSFSRWTEANARRERREERFFSRSILRACLRSPGKGKSLIYAVAVWRIGWQ